MVVKNVVVVAMKGNSWQIDQKINLKQWPLMMVRQRFVVEIMVMIGDGAGWVLSVTVGDSCSSGDRQRQCRTSREFEGGTSRVWVVCTVDEQLIKGGG